MMSTLEDRLASAVETGRIVGLSAAVVGAEGPIWSGAFGRADLISARPATGATAYPWFSMTKIVTATAIMQLVERGSLGLDDPVVDLVPEMAAVRAPVPITVRHLLSHSSGLANPIPVRWVHPASSPGPDPGRFLARQLRRHRRLRSVPGTRAAYTNLGYLVLGQVVAAVAGVEFDEYVRTAVLRPLGMTATSVAGPAGPDETTVYQRVPPVLTPVLRLALPPGIVGPRQGPWLGYRPFRVHGAAYGGLVGPVDDAARFLAAHLGDGTAGGRPLLGRDSREAMQQITMAGTPYNLGLGWYTPASLPAGAPRFVEHLGGGLGVYNVMRLYPERGVGVVILANTPGYDLEKVVSLLVDGLV